MSITLSHLKTKCGWEGRSHSFSYSFDKYLLSPNYVLCVNIDILGISELKWTGMGEFNSDDPYIYYCGQESLRRNGVAIIVNKRV